MGSRIGAKRPVASQRRRCVVRGCAEPVRGDALLCQVHAAALWPGPPSPPEQPDDAA